MCGAQYGYHVLLTSITMDYGLSQCGCVCMRFQFACSVCATLCLHKYYELLAYWCTQGKSVCVTAFMSGGGNWANKTHVNPVQDLPFIALEEKILSTQWRNVPMIGKYTEQLTRHTQS